MMVPRNNKLTTTRKVELWLMAHGVEWLIKIVLFLFGMALMYCIMFAQAWCFDQHVTAWHALGWMILVLAGSFIYYVIRPLPER